MEQHVMSEERSPVRRKKKFVVRVSLYEGVDDDLLRELEEISSKYRRSSRVVELMRMGLERLRGGVHPTMMVAAVPAPLQAVSNRFGTMSRPGAPVGASPEEDAKVAAAAAEQERAAKELRVRRLEGLFGQQDSSDE
jgi:hypothetical protein